MDEKSIRELYASAMRLLDQHRLKEALTQLTSMCGECPDWVASERVEQIKTSYGYMLEYMKQGAADPGREPLYHKLTAQAYAVADRLQLALLDEVSPRYYHTLRKARSRQGITTDLRQLLTTLEGFTDELAVCRLVPDDRNQLDSVMRRHEEALQQLFLGTWTNSEWSAEEVRLAGDYLLSEQLTANDLCLLVSAVTLSSLECFDPAKLQWLLDVYLAANPAASARALVGVALVLQAWGGRILQHTDLTARLSLIDEDGSLGRDLNRVYLQLLLSLGTGDIDRRMREEIIPEMMRNVQQLRHLRFGSDENDDENDANPDWQEALEQSGLGDKIREMNELQEEGADVNISTFSNLKRYPHFSQLQNWFYPFERYHSSVVQVLGPQSGTTDALGILLSSPFFCESDKYSLCLTLQHIPAEQRDRMLSQMTSTDIRQLLDESRSTALREQAARPEVISNQYIHDLYRFYHLHPRHKEFPNPFERDMTLHTLPVLDGLLSRPELLSAVADFHFRKKHFSQARAIYHILIDRQADADLFQKTGFCLQQEKRYAEAVEAYRKADVLKPDHLWTLRHLAACYRRLHAFDMALDYYQRVGEMLPDDRTVLFYTGVCFSELNRYEEALQCFFKLDLLDSDNQKAWRAIGWCSFMSGKYEQAARYEDKVLSQPQPTASDYLNRGHVCLAIGDIVGSVQYYRQAMTLCPTSDAFIDLFRKDEEILIRQGVPSYTLPLVLDMVI